MKTPKTSDYMQSGKVKADWQDNVLPCSSGRLKANLEHPTAPISQVTQKEMPSEQVSFCSKEDALVAIRERLSYKTDNLNEKQGGKHGK